MYSYEILPSLQKILRKLANRDRTTYEQVFNKTGEIIQSTDVEHYKNLRHDMKDRKRVHIGSFVLIFKFVKSENKIIFVDFDHHNNVYNG